MSSAQIFYAICIAGCIYIAIDQSKPLSATRDDSGRMFIVLAVVWAAGVGYLAGAEAGKSDMFERVESAMTRALPDRMYDAVMRELAEQEEARNAIAEAEAEARSATGGRYGQ